METRLTCGPFAFDRRTQTVWRGGEALPALGLRAALLLEALLRRPGEILTKSELMDAAWNGLVVEDGNLSVQIAALRKILGSASDGRDWIATVHRVGYRFLVSEERPVAGPAIAETNSIAVLPFVSLSPEPAHTYFADGLAEDIITALGRLEGLTVIARNSSFAYRGSDIDIRRVGEELDVRHVFTGSVRRAGTRIRVGVQLAESQSGGQVWAETYEHETGDEFAIQDDVTTRVVDALRGTFGLRGREVASGGTRDPEALELYRRGRAIMEDPQMSAERNAEGRALIEQAVSRDPHFASALTYLTISHITDHSNDWGTNQASLDLARATADAAIAAAPQFAGGHAVRSIVASFDHDPERQDTESLLAMTLSPHDVLPRAGFLVDSGEPEAAIPLYERAIRVNPTMTPLFMHHLARAYLHAGRYETAAAIFRARIALVPNTDMSRALLCVAVGHLGEIEEAQRVWAELMTINPNYSLERRLSRSWSREAVELKREGLRKAGLPLA